MLGPGPGGSEESWRGLKRWCCNQGCVLKIRISRHTVGLIAGHCYLPKCHPPSGHHLAPVWLELQWDCLKIEAIPTLVGKSPHSGGNGGQPAVYSRTLWTQSQWSRGALAQPCLPGWNLGAVLAR